MDLQSITDKTTIYKEIKQKEKKNNSQGERQKSKLSFQTFTLFKTYPLTTYSDFCK